MEFRILGPLEVTAGSQRLELGGARQQAVLAALLLGANGLVTTDRLLEAVYGENLPPTSRSQVQISISSLRRLLGAHGSPEVIVTRPQGYVLQLGGSSLDSRRFAELTTAARVAREGGQRGEAVACYRDALRLWRGPALEDIDSQLLRGAASRLDEQRIAVNEDRLELELDLGRHHELVGELTELVSQFPLRERLRGQLMLALYRCGRSAEALQAYRQARQDMIDELGLEPGQPLQRLERAILTSDPSLDLPAAVAAASAAAGPVRQSAPSLLPADIADFIDRAEHVSEIRDRLIRAGAGAAPSALPVVVLVGRGGVGKTSLAVHASHGVAKHFGDGQLFADLHGGSSRPVGPLHVLERFLRVLGVPGSQLPEGLDERAEVYRNLLAGRRMLVVLDDVGDESQMRPLLPGSGSAAVLVTSRSRLAALPGAVRVQVDVLGADHSLSLLDHVVGGGRVRAQARAAEAVAEHCGYLPLALRIAGARLSARPHWSVQQLAERLADETRRLDELSHGDMGVRASISLSYLGASEPARRLLRRLALVEAPAVPGWLAIALLDQPAETAEDLLDELISAHLLEVAGAGTDWHGRYRFHDLVRAFARERLAAEETTEEQQAALRRALGALLYMARQNLRRYAGEWGNLMLGQSAPDWPLPSPLADGLTANPLSWYESERVTLVWGIRQAARAGLVDVCCSLMLCAEELFETRAYFDDWRETCETALLAAREAGHIRGQALMLYSRASLGLEQGRLTDARQDVDAAVELFKEAGDDYGFAMAIRITGFVDRLWGRLDDAARHFDHALVTLRRVGDAEAIAYTLQQLAMVCLEREQPDVAMPMLSEALSISRAASGRARTQAQVLYVTGETHLQAGDLASAVSAYEQALVTVRESGDTVGEAVVLRGLGVAALRLGRLDQARDALRQSRDLSAAAGQRMAEARAVLALSELALASGEPAQALKLAQQAAAAFRDLGTPRDHARALTAVSQAHTALY